MTWRHGPRPAIAPGFSLVELVVVLAFIGLILGLGLPALQQFIHRGKIEGSARETAALMQAARFESIKRGRAAVVRVDRGDRRVAAFIDEDADSQEDPGERLLAQLILPAGVEVAAPGSEPPIDGLATAGDEGWAIYNPDGSAAAGGAVRLGDPRGNYLEVRIMLAATGRVEVRKWDEVAASWRAPGEGGEPWTWQ